ncbi:MAG: hypothetical protein KJ955_01855 [Nanoarchaeota archaeon]|nr:hypothetical protein [Nanoarchaeota archaeon]
MGNEPPDPAALIRAKEISDLLFNAITEMGDDKEKLVILCRFYMHLSPEETSGRMGVECEYARQLEKQAIASLNERLEGILSIDDVDASHYCMPDMDKVTALYRKLVFRVIPGGKS